MVSGTAVIMWMGELITGRGVGNGMSVLIFTTVISVIPGELLAIYRDKGAFYAAVAIVVVIAIIAFIVFMEQAQRRIPVQYAKRMVGRRMYGGTSTYIPMKVNQAGVIPTMVAGTTGIKWMGELITDRGVGNGMSVLIFTTVISVIPGEILAIYRVKGAFYAAIAIVVVVAIVAVIGFVVFIEQAQRRIPVQYARRMTGRRVYGGATTYIPLKVNQAGVIPVIFASSLLFLPQTAASFLGNTNQGWVAWVARYVEQSNSVFYMLAFFLLIVGFTYFYVSITFNPTEVADNMKKYGGFIPGIRPGRPTAEYLQYVLSRLTAPGSVYLGMPTT